MPKYTVLSPVKTADGKGENRQQLEPGDTIELNAKDAKELIAAGVIAPQGKQGQQGQEG